MKNEFERIEKGLKLIREEGEKNIKDVSFANNFLNSLGKERFVFMPLKLKYSFIFLIVFFLISNIFLIYKINLCQKKLIVFNTPKIEEKQSLIKEKEINLKKEKIEIKNIEKQSSSEKNLSKKSVEINKYEEFSQSKLEQTIKFTEEVNKLLGLFIIDINMEEKNES